MSSSLTLLLWVCLAFDFALAVRARPYTKVSDVRKYSAVGNGKIDCSKAFVKAWEEACAWEGDAIVYIPRETYYAGVTIFIGRQKCKYQAVKFQVEGIVKAPTNLITGDGWIKFQYIERMTIDGGGTFDGQGALAWKHNDCIKNPHCKILTKGFVSREYSNTPRYYDGRYWTMWKLPMFGCTDASQVLAELEEAKKAYPNAFVRIIGFDNKRQVQCISFIAYKPETY